MGNRSLQLCTKIDYFLTILKDGIKVVRLDPKEVHEQTLKCQASLIGYVVGGNPSFKEILRYVYGVWNFVETPQVFLHTDGYFIFCFATEEDKAVILENGPYTFNNRPLVVRQW